MTPMHEFSYFFLKLWIFFCNFFPFEILSHNLNFDSTHWLSKDVQWIIEKVFRKKVWFKGLGHSPPAFFY